MRPFHIKRSLIISHGYFFLLFIPKSLLIMTYCNFIGVKIIEKVSVNKVLTEDDQVCGVNTTHGDIKCDYFVNCAGQVSKKFIISVLKELQHWCIRDTCK